VFDSGKHFKLCYRTVWLIGPIRKLRRKWSVVNTAPETYDASKLVTTVKSFIVQAQRRADQRLRRQFDLDNWPNSDEIKRIITVILHSLNCLITRQTLNQVHSCSFNNNYFF